MLVTGWATRSFRTIKSIQKFKLNGDWIPDWMWDWSSQFTGAWRWILAGLGCALAFGAAVGIHPLAGVAPALMLTLFVLVAPKPIVLLYALCLSQPLLGGMARGLGIPLLRPSQAIVVGGFGLMILARRQPLGKARFSIVDAATVLWIMGGAFFPILYVLWRGGSIGGDENQFGQSPIQIIFGPIQYYLLYRTVVSIMSSQKQIRTAIILLFVASCIVSIIGILQKLGVGPVKEMIATYFPSPSHGYEIDELKQRITSTLQHYAGLGSYLAFTIVLALSCYCFQQKLRINQGLLVATLLLDSVALILTGTMAAWGGLVAGALVVFKLTNHVPKPVVFISIGIAVAAVVFQPFIAARFDEQVGEGASDGILPQSMQFRVRLWTETFIPAVFENPIFGAGPTPSTSNSWAIEETQFLYLLLRGGFVYFGAYCYLMYAIAKLCMKRIKTATKDADHAVAVAVYSIIIFLNLMNIAGEYFTYVGGTQLFWILTALVVASHQMDFKPDVVTEESPEEEFIPFWKKIKLDRLKRLAGLRANER